jgi:1-phosphatidylinositol-4-phosphate 5-kinase
VIWTTLAVSNVVSGLNCEYFHKPGLNISITLGNTAKLATPIVLSILRYYDPTIRTKIIRLYRSLFKRERTHTQCLIL